MKIWNIDEFWLGYELSTDLGLLLTYDRGAGALAFSMVYARHCLHTLYGNANCEFLVLARSYANRIIES